MVGYTVQRIFPLTNTYTAFHYCQALEKAVSIHRKLRVLRKHFSFYTNFVLKPWTFNCSFVEMYLQLYTVNDCHDGFHCKF
jgi:hypothetical protein